MTPAALRQRRFRQRVLHGIEVLRVPVQTDAVVEALVRGARLKEDEALNKANVEAAVAKLVAEWAETQSA